MKQGIWADVYLMDRANLNAGGGKDKVFRLVARNDRTNYFTVLEATMEQAVEKLSGQLAATKKAGGLIPELGNPDEEPDTNAHGVVFIPVE